jgi:hypothetical protein
MSSERPILYCYFEDSVKVLLANYKRSANQNADSNLGKNRENFCNYFLKKVLPSIHKKWRNMGFKRV